MNVNKLIEDYKVKLEAIDEQLAAVPPLNWYNRGKLEDRKGYYQGFLAELKQLQAEQSKKEVKLLGLVIEASRSVETTLAECKGGMG